jgi:hypothetical protein
LCVNPFPNLSHFCIQRCNLSFLSWAETPGLTSLGPYASLCLCVPGAAGSGVLGRGGGIPQGKKTLTSEANQKLRDDDDDDDHLEVTRNTFFLQSLRHMRRMNEVRTNRARGVWGVSPQESPISVPNERSKSDVILYDTCEGQGAVGAPGTCGGLVLGSPSNYIYPKQVTIAHSTSVAGRQVIL